MCHACVGSCHGCAAVQQQVLPVPALRSRDHEVQRLLHQHTLPHEPASFSCNFHSVDSSPTSQAGVSAICPPSCCLSLDQELTSVARVRLVQDSCRCQVGGLPCRWWPQAAVVDVRLLLIANTANKDTQDAKHLEMIDLDLSALHVCFPQSMDGPPQPRPGVATSGLRIYLKRLPSTKTK